ncbi:IclR family transcriptional regulator [Brachybacterium sacelli]|uniref:DNA-binding IclR family transcriptional regulator n=1 Tax=Brachybacterium sacelli TaxID=173364 RepID=A0ABS4WYA6_9MICO|nr:IclR family transcriptional regulator [Brachybacterium sacelli]MBP2380963.1 DNA-binding IclR family transcriptional regulator [Brachybacterium sacelli]
MTTTPETAASPVGSVDKALALLEILAEAGPDGLTLREITASSGLNKASVHRLLRALIHRGFAEQVQPDQRYRLGSAVPVLAGRFERGENLPVLFAPALAAISHRTQELVHLGRLDGPHVLYLDKVEPERTLRVWSSIGKRAPAARTAMGRALLAADGVRGQALDAYARATAAETAEVGQVIALEHLAEVVDRTAARGWSMEIEENETGIACVGVALVRPGGRSVSVSVTGPIERMDERRRAGIGDLLREELSRLAPAGFEVAPTA